MQDIQTDLNVNFITDRMYDETSTASIFLNIFGSNYTNFNFNITDGNKVTMKNSAALIGGQIYLFKGGLDLTDIIKNMPSGADNRITVFLIYDYDFDDELGEDIVSNPKLSLTNEGAGGQIKVPVGVFIKNETANTIEWIKEADDNLNALIQGTINGETILKSELPEDGWLEGDIITFPDNVLKYKRIELYPLSKNSTDPENPTLSNNMQKGLIPDTWEYNGQIMCAAGFANTATNELVTWQTIFDNYKDDTKSEELPANQVRLKTYKSFNHNQSGLPHSLLVQNDYIYKIVVKRY